MRIRKKSKPHAPKDPEFEALMRKRSEVMFPKKPRYALSEIDKRILWSAALAFPVWMIACFVGFRINSQSTGAAGVEGVLFCGLIYVLAFCAFLVIAATAYVFIRETLELLGGTIQFYDEARNVWLVRVDWYSGWRKMCVLAGVIWTILVPIKASTFASYWYASVLKTYPPHLMCYPHRMAIALGWVVGGWLLLFCIHRAFRNAFLWAVVR